MRNTVFNHKAKGLYIKISHHLYELGMINKQEYNLRLEGLKACLNKSGVEFDNEDTWFIRPSLDAGYHEIIRREKELEKYDCLFACTDFIACGALLGCNEIGISVPRDLSVIGYDDIKISRYIKPSLTTVHQPLDLIASMICVRLIESIRAKEKGKSWKTKRISLKPEIVYRDSFV